MSEEVDELFGKGGDTANPRTALALGLLIAGLLLAILGACCTSIPGGLLVLLGWFVAQRDLDRVESGYLAKDHLGSVVAVRLACALGIVAVIVMLFFQTWLYGSIGPDGLVNWLLSGGATDPVP